MDNHQSITPENYMPETLEEEKFFEPQEQEEKIDPTVEVEKTLNQLLPMLEKFIDPVLEKWLSRAKTLQLEQEERALWIDVYLKEGSTEKADLAILYFRQRDFSR